MSGITHFAQCFYDDVRIPLANVVGRLNGGWGVAMTTLGFERGTANIAHQIELSRTVEKLVAIAGELDAHDGRRKAITMRSRPNLRPYAPRSPPFDR